MKGLISFFLLITSLFSFLNANQYLEFTTEKFTKIVADEISRTLPKKLNETTVLTSVRSEKSKLLFTGNLLEKEYEKKHPQISFTNLTSVEKENFKKEMIDKMQKTQLDELCTSLTTRTVLESGVTFKYTYFFKSDNSLIGETNIALEDCLENKI